MNSDQLQIRESTNTKTSTHAQLTEHSLCQQCPDLVLPVVARLAAEHLQRFLASTISQKHRVLIPQQKLDASMLIVAPRYKHHTNIMSTRLLKHKLLLFCHVWALKYKLCHSGIKLCSLPLLPKILVIMMIVVQAGVESNMQSKVTEGKIW